MCWNYKNINDLKRSQVTIFIIFAIVILAVVILVVFLLRDIPVNQKIPSEVEEAYSYYLECVKGISLDGSRIIGTQGGYINNPSFKPGSSYMPFSSQLDFLGNGVPYWYYISGNGVLKEQVPRKTKIESELAEYIEEEIDSCDFLEFEEKGYIIAKEDALIGVQINLNEIIVNVDQNLIINKDEILWNSKNHVINVPSNLGRFYELSRKIFNDWKETMFLENYGIDILRLYAPVDGTELSCSTKIWSVDSVREDLIRALEANIPAIKIKGDYYSLQKEQNKYFEYDLGDYIDENVNFLYLGDFPMKMEVFPSEDGIMRADPVGLQEGLGMLGFCYVPYHFVYDFYFPVLIQVYNDEELFQFPVVVSINKNQKRVALNGERLPDLGSNLCEYKNRELNIFTYDSFLEGVNADIDFKCFDESCYIGKTSLDSQSKLVGFVPDCVNGYIVAKAKGYETKKQVVGNFSENVVVIILEKEYTLDLEVKVGSEIAKNAVVSFEKINGTTKTISYPAINEVILSPGQYNIKTYVYHDTQISLQGSRNQKCVDVPMSGIGGFIGQTQEKCFDLEIPSQVVESGVLGGGVTKYFVSESELMNSEKLIINSKNFGVPTKIEDLQSNYNQVEVNNLYLTFI